MTTGKFFFFSEKDSHGEMGMYDIPAMYKEILSVYPTHKIYTTGYSQGTSEMFAGLVDEVSSEFLTAHTEKFIAIAPIVYLNNLDSWFWRGLAKLTMGHSNFFSNFPNKRNRPLESDRQLVWVQTLFAYDLSVQAYLREIRRLVLQPAACEVPLSKFHPRDSY
jgi:hypothetical protein